MHDRDLDALIKDRPPTEFEKHMHDLEVRRLEDLAQRIKGNAELAKSRGVESDVKLEELANEDARRIARELAERISRRPPPNLVLESKTECCCKTTAPALPTATELLGRQAWSLKCLLQDIRSTSKVLYGEQRANATLAVRHLEDALHRINLALEE